MACSTNYEEVKSPSNFDHWPSKTAYDDERCGVPDVKLGARFVAWGCRGSRLSRIAAIT
jgi:hypothetical protein